MKPTEIKEIKDEVTFPMQRHRVTVQDTNTKRIATGEFKPSKNEAAQNANERLGELLSEDKKKPQ